MDEESIRTALQAAFAVTGAGTPGWPDPHPDIDREIDAAEYSRCLDPGKYRILAARTQAWTQALSELDLAEVEAIEPTAAASAWRQGASQAHSPAHAPTRTHRLRPHQPGALPLLIDVHGFDGLKDNAVALGAGEPAVLLTHVPVCGCDACDDGSTVLLDQLDDAVLDVITGAFAHVDTPHGAVQGGRGGWQAEGSAGNLDVEQLLEQARTGSCPHPAVHGTRWW
ncbi:DUF6226 family protein [Kineococcus esterisolvens]|uniref:DUF6226 family protein n=1 Tax=unclassified Kineococcus TaxID=2621656 RepID=UPI003D7DCEE7